MWLNPLDNPQWSITLARTLATLEAVWESIPAPPLVVPAPLWLTEEAADLVSTGIGWNKLVAGGLLLRHGYQETPELTAWVASLRPFKIEIREELTRCTGAFREDLMRMIQETPLPEATSFEVRFLREDRERLEAVWSVLRRLESKKRQPFWQIDDLGLEYLAGTDLECPSNLLVNVSLMYVFDWWGAFGVDLEFIREFSD